MSPNRTGRGHRSLPHTADVAIEAWGRTREECLAEAVTGVVESFADAEGVPATVDDTVLLPEGSGEDLLVTLMSEVIVRMDVDGLVPVETEAHRVPGGVEVRFALAALDDVAIVGASPKAVSLHRLRCGPGPHGWACSMILDV